MVTAAKTTSQIGMHMAVAFGVMYACTGSLAFGGLAALIEPICNVILMPLHDRLWERIRARMESGPQQMHLQPVPVATRSPRGRHYA